MEAIDIVCMWIAEIALLLGSVAATVYGAFAFFKKRKALYPKVVTAAMGCYALSCLYHICQTLIFEEAIEGFTATYLGRMGFYLFLFTANFGQMNGIMDDGNPKMRPSRYIGLSGPLLAAALFGLVLLADIPLSTKLSYLPVWIGAALSLYYTLKHAVIPDLGYGFSKAVRPYNVSASVLAALDLLTLLAWAYYDLPYGFIIVAVTSVLTSVTMLITIRNLNVGVSRWTI